MKELQGNSVTIIIIKPNSISYMFFVQLENKYLLYAYILFSYTYGKLTNAQVQANNRDYPKRLRSRLNADISVHVYNYQEAACSSHTALIMSVLTVLEIFFVKLKSLWFRHLSSSQSQPHLPLMHWRHQSTGMHFKWKPSRPDRIPDKLIHFLEFRQLQLQGHNCL